MNVPTADMQGRLDRYRSFLTQDPENIGILRELVDLEIQAGEFESARAHLSAGLARQPEEPGLLSRQATLALAQGRPQDAVPVLQTLMARGEDHPALRYNLAYALTLSNDFDAARAALQPSMDADNASPEAHLLFGRVLHHLGDLGQALLHTRHYQTAYPDKVEGHAQQALHYLDMEEQQLARQYADKAYAIDPTNREALLVLSSLAVAEGEPQAAKQLLTQVMERYPESGRAWLNLGLVGMMEFDLPQSVEALRKSARYMPEHIGTWHALAWCQLVMGKLDDAEQTFTQAMDIDRNFGETHGGLAVIAAMRGKTDDASRLAKVALRLDPSSFSARFAQSLLTSKTDPEKAQAMIQAIMQSQVEGTDQNLANLVSRVFSKRR